MKAWDRELSEDELLALMEKFTSTYDYMYENNDEIECGLVKSEMIDLGDALLQSNIPLVGQFIRFRDDLLTSDREVAAFAVAVVQSGYVKI